MVRFAVVGTAGFCIDAAVLTVALAHAGWNAYSGRALSFTIAVLATWLMNRAWTFARGSSQGVGRVAGEALRYFLVQAVGSLANLATFFAAIAIYPTLVRAPVIPLAIGALVGLCVNFYGAREWVFIGDGAIAARDSMMLPPT